ncbi:hypothetical protein FRB99_008503 [Tulasnella sp. 403]|nr:hypothetical protein FRB99_008503 [Tulasnella sp. 403]
MDEQSMGLLQNMNTHLDILLFFAGLFAGLNGALIIITLAFFTPGTSDTIDTTLYILTQDISNPNVIPSDSYPTPTLSGPTRINCYFSTSFACSLAAALGAIIGKQWLNDYDRNTDVDPVQSGRPLRLGQQGPEQLRRHSGLQHWQWHVIINLPTFLQFTVLIFDIGVIDLASLVTSATGRARLKIVVAVFVAHGFTFALWDADYPIRTLVVKVIFPYISNSFPWKYPDNETSSPTTEARDSEASQRITPIIPPLHIPSILRTKYPETAAILELESQFQGVFRNYIASNSQSRQVTSDLLIHVETLFSVLLASFVDARAQSGPDHPCVPAWWKTYGDCISLAWRNPPGPAIKELWHYKIVASYISTQESTFVSLFPFVWDQERLPLHVAGVLCFYVSSGQPWDHILRQSLRLLDPNSSGAEPSGVDGRGFTGRWNVVSMAAWTLSQSSRPIDPSEVPKYVKAIWNAYIDADTLLSNFSRCCNAYGEVQLPEDETTGRAKIQVYQWVIRSVRIIVQDLEDVDSDWAEVALGCLQLVTSAATCRWSQQDQLIRPMVEDCLKIMTKTSYYVSFEVLDGLWPIISPQNTPLALLEPILEFLARSLPYHPGDVSRVFTNHPDTLDRIVEFLSHPSETLRIDILYLLGRGTISSTQHNFVNTTFAWLLARQLKLSPTRPFTMFEAFYSYLQCFIDRTPSLHLTTCAFYDEAVSQPVDANSVATALVFWDNLSGDMRRHPDWFSHEFLNVATEYLVTMSRSPDSWQNSTWAVTSAVRGYYNAVLSPNSLAAADDPAVLYFKKAFTRWKRCCRD